MNNTSGLVLTHDKVLLKLLVIEEKTAGGIVLATKTQEKETQAAYIGQFVTAGKTALASEELDGIVPGDMIMFAKYSGMVVQGADAMYRVIRVTDVVGKTTGLYEKRLQGSIPMPDNS
jgi:co-chaperonin GroES (HSP10)